MESHLNDPKIIQPEDIDPHHEWSRALRDSDLGSLLTFENNNIRYITSTAIGERARDKMCRFALLPAGGDPHLGLLMPPHFGI